MGKILKYQDFVSEKKDPCWPGYRQLGTKLKRGKKVPNCVKVNEGDSGFDRTGFYMDYYKNVSPSDFNIEREDNSITITIPGQKEIQSIQGIAVDAPLVFK